MALRPNENAAVARLEAQLEILTSTVKGYMEEAKDDRHTMTVAIEDIRLNASHTKRSITELVEWKSQVQPYLGEIEKWKQRGIGAWMLMVMVSGSAIALVTYLWKSIIAYLAGQSS
jgi:hypothetical protein